MSDGQTIPGGLHGLSPSPNRNLNKPGPCLHCDLVMRRSRYRHGARSSSSRRDTLNWLLSGYYPMPQSATERPVILIVEDEFLIRMHAAEMIKQAGYDVIEAASADDAIVILEARRDIRVVFTDVRMPGSMDGLN
jgi:PleD family two-component response regulator